MLSRRSLAVRWAWLLVAPLFLLAPAASRAETTAADIPPAALKAKLDAGLFAPVDGISVREFAHIVFDLFARDDLGEAKILADHKVTKAQFDHANEVMTGRMKDDKTFKFIDIYGAYYIETAPGPFAALAKDVSNSVLNGVPLREPEPMKWEDYMRITGFYARKAPFAKDTSRRSYDEILGDQGINFIDFQVLGAWFSRRVALGAPN